MSVNTAFAESLWTNTLGGTFDWNSAGNWSGTFPPSSADDVRITNELASAQLITNMGGASAIGATNTINFLAVSNGLGSASVTVQQTPGVFWRSLFGFQLGKNATLILTTNAVIGSNQNVTFGLRPGGQPGTLVLSNAAATSGLSTFIVALAVGAPTNGISNAGTIQLNPNNSQLVSINYGQTSAFTNDALGTIVMSGSGTGAFIGNFGSGNRALINNGTIFVSAGTFRIDPRDAFSRGGFQSGTTGLIQVDTNAVFELRRTTNAWANAAAVSPTNFGTVFMNGGTMLTFDLDQNGNALGTNTARAVVNATNGVFRGNGLMNFTMRNLGTIESRDGTLSTVASTGNNGTWVSTNYGGNVSVLNFTTGNFDLGGGTLLNSNGTVRAINGANMTLSTSYRQNLGTIDFAGAANVLIANSASADSVTNEFVIKKTASGQATLTTGFGSSQNNFGFINNGTVSVSGGGTLTINSANAFFKSFSNTVNGTVGIDAGNTLRIARTVDAWTNGFAPFNSGTITLNGGTIAMADTNTVNVRRYLNNAGLIQGNGTISGSVSNLAGGVVSPGFSLGTNAIGGDIVFGSNSAFVVELGALAGQDDLLSVASNLTLDANSVLNISGGAVGNVYTVATYSTRSGTFGSATPFYNIDYLSGALTIAPIPVTLTITATASANGTITPSGAVAVTNGNDQPFLITPDTCYQVADVLVDGSSFGPASSVTFFGVTSNHTISASFSLLTYTITASAGANGSISPSGAVGVNCGTNLDFIITPNTGYHIADVLVDSVSVSAVSSYTFTGVMTPHAISASFAINTYAVTATAGVGGTITPSGAVSVNHGDDQTFTIAPDACYHVDDVLIDSISVGAISSYTFTNVTAAHTIDASFAINTYTITASASTNGSISPSGAVSVDCGTNQTFTVTPDTGYPIVDVLVDSVSVGAVSSYTFTNVTANHTIDASFATELLRIVSITRAGDDIRLTWTTAGGNSYVVQSTLGSGGSYSNDFTDLSSAIVIPGTGESTTNYLDIGATTNSPAIYYRVRLAP